jgi:hypothetical protein
VNFRDPQIQIHSSTFLHFQTYYTYAYPLSIKQLPFILTELEPSWSYGSWIYNYLCNRCLSPLLNAGTVPTVCYIFVHFYLDFFVPPQNDVATPKLWNKAGWTGQGRNSFCKIEKENIRMHFFLIKTTTKLFMTILRLIRRVRQFDRRNKNL